MLSEDQIVSLFDAERALTLHERRVKAELWRRLRRENAAFRIVTDKGLESAPSDVFDPVILRRATTDWQRVVRVIGDVIGYSEPYRQTGDVMVHMRILALIEAGRLEVEGDLGDMRESRVRLSQHTPGPEARAL